MNALGDQSQPNHGESLLAGRYYGLSCKPQCVPRSVRAKSLEAVCISAFEVSFGAGGQHQQIEGSNFRGAYWSWVQHAIDQTGQVRAAKQASQCSALSFPRTSPQLGRGALGPLPVEFCILLEGPFSITFSLVVIKPLPLYH